MKKRGLIFIGVVLIGLSACNNKISNDAQAMTSADTLKLGVASKQPDTLHFRDQVINLEQIDSNSFHSLVKDSGMERNVDKNFDSLNVYVHDSTLVFRLENGDSVKLISKPNDPTDGIVIHNYVRFVPALNSYLISNTYYESGDVSIINRTTGKEIVLYGEPVLSPDKKIAVSYNCDVMALESPNGFQILSVSSDSINILWEAIPDGWGPEECRWKDNTTLYMRTAYVDSNSRKEKSVKLRLPDFAK